MQDILLRGITWNHSRGYLPMVATAQRFAESHPGCEIVWDKRSLQAFADEPVGELAKRYDLLVIDHPWAGFAAASGVLLPLDEYLPAAFLADQAAHSVGPSHGSYAFGAHHWALAIDAAAPVASYRPDLLDNPPATWAELLDLARQGRVVMPGIPIDTLMNFYMLCSTLDSARANPLFDSTERAADVAQSVERLVSREVGVRALEMLRELAALLSEEVYDFNPIRVYEAMAGREDYAYCPFAYGYSNYARPGYVRKLLKFADLVEINGRRCRSTLGGTGLAVSAACRHPQLALEYAAYTASAECQRGLYFQNGGQPGHRSAWLDASVNAACGNYFLDTLPALDRAFLRPRYPGHMAFQDRAGAPIQDYLRHGGDVDSVLDHLNILYRQSLQDGLT